MDIGNIFGKIEGNADKIGGVLGAISTISEQGSGNLMNGVTVLLDGLMKDPHFPNLEHIASNLTRWNKAFMPSLQAAIIGWLMKEIDIHPTIERFGNVLMKAGIGSATASAALVALYFSGAYHSGGSSGGGSSGGWGR